MPTPTVPPRRGRHRSGIIMLCAIALIAFTARASGTATDAEIRPEIVAAYPESFPPLFRATASGVPTGFGIEVMEEVAREAGLRIVYRAQPNWEQTLAAVANGAADVIPNLGITEERRASFDFGDPYESEPVGLFVRADDTSTTRLSDAAKAGVIGVVKGNVGESLVTDATSVRYRVFDSAANAILELKEGGIAALIFPAPIFRYFAGELELDDEFRQAGPALAEVQRSFAVRKGNTELLNRLNTALPAVVASHAYKHIYDRWFPPPPSYWTTRRLTLAAAAVMALALLAGLVARLRSLRVANRNLAHSNDFNAAVLNSVLEGVITLNSNGTIYCANTAAQAMLGRADAELDGEPLATIFPTEHAETIQDTLRELAAQPSSIHTGPPPFRTINAIRNDGAVFPVRIGIATADINAETHFVLTVHDTSEQYQAEQQVEYLVDHDPLTGLLNTHGLTLVLPSLLGQARRNSRPLCCLTVGISHFGHINEAYGRQTGDEVLIKVGAFLRDALRAGDLSARSDDNLLARCGGDRFLIVLPETPLEGAKALAARVLAAVAALEITHDGSRIHVDARAGIATFPDHTETAEELLSHAETALHLAKSDPVAPIGVFSMATRDRVSHTERTLDQLREALQKDRIVAHFQPILDIRSGRIHHFEVLSRIQRADGSLMMPNDFIPVAERFGLITRIDYRVLELAFANLCGLSTVAPNVVLAVNLSAAHIGDDDLLRWLKEVFAEGSVQPRNVIFELTETAALQNTVSARSFMEPLRNLGCQFALDDFGVGFTSFAQLRALPVDIVKIDGMFVRHLDDNKEDQAVCRSIIDVAHSLNKKVVAEFVEREELLALLGRYGVDFAQGYYIGRPRPDLPEMIAELRHVKAVAELE